MNELNKVALLDNYDSFSYNLVQIVEQKHEIDVYRNDQVSIDQLSKYDRIILSPGPGLPKDAGIMFEAIAKLGPKMKIFGVCLGMQAIAEVYGCKLKNLDRVYHGLSTAIHQKENTCAIYHDVPLVFEAGRYHSWAIDESTLNPSLSVTAVSADNEIMSIRHNEFEVFGVQYHPESIMTPEGARIIENFLNL